MPEKRSRRSKREVVVEKIAKIDEAIKAHECKISVLKTEREDLQKMLKDMDEAENQENIENVLNKIAAAIKKNKITLENVEALLETAGTEQ